MKVLTRDISFTLVIKFILLFLLWWFCIKGMRPALQPAQDWFFGKASPTVDKINPGTEVIP